MYEVKNLHFSFGSEPILEDLNLELPSQGVLAVLGPNGCGKSTLIKIMTGILVPNQGHLYWEKERIHALSTMERARLFSWCSPSMPDTSSMSVYKLLIQGFHPFLGSHLYNDMEAQIEAVVEGLNLGDILRKPLHQLSSGNLRLAHLARSLVSPVKVVFLDEPFANLDIRVQLQTMSFLKKLGLKKLIVFSSHNLESVLDLASQGIFYCGEKGFVAAPIESGMQDADFQNAMGVRLEWVEGPFGKLLARTFL